jgi:cation transport ATPase
MLFDISLIDVMVLPLTSPSMLVAGTNVYTVAAKPLTIAPFAGKQVHMIAAAAMSFSSVSVITNALRLKTAEF